MVNAVYAAGEDRPRTAVKCNPVDGHCCRHGTACWSLVRKVNGSEGTVRTREGEEAGRKPGVQHVLILETKEFGATLELEVGMLMLRL
jgi:hypothetical protein